MNAASRCTAELLCGSGGAIGLRVPVRLGRVVVSSDEGAVLFTGYLATEPVQVYAGESTTGAAYRTRISAVSDEWLLDRAGVGVNSVGRMAVKVDSPVF